MSDTEEDGLSHRILTEAQVREAWALTGGPSIADWPHLTDTKKWHWRNLAEHILRRYGGIPEAEARRREREAFLAGAEYRAYAPLPTPAPAQEPEARTNLLGRGGLNAALVDLTARVRALEGK